MHNGSLLGGKDDNMRLELAHESMVDFLIIGNTNNFTILKYEETLIVTAHN